MHRHPPRAGAAPQLDAVIVALRERLAKVQVGNPELESVRMGPVVGLEQRREVLDRVGKLRSEAEIVFGDPADFKVEGADKVRGAFIPPASALRRSRSRNASARGRSIRAGVYGDGI